MTGEGQCKKETNPQKRDRFLCNVSSYSIALPEQKSKKVGLRWNN